MTASTMETTQSANQRGEVNARRWKTCSCHRLRLPSAMVAALFVFIVTADARLIHAQDYSVLHNFNGSPGDGAGPAAGVVRDASGNFYGTTMNGGSAGNGTVFKIDSAGNVTVLHSFTGGSDGAEPFYAGLVMDTSGNLYGTTLAGGPSSAGTVFKVDPSGNETILHSFSFDGVDGALPVVGLVIDSDGNLYGTTDAGGPSNAGTVFKVDRSGNETVLHSFTSSDGAHPEAGLLRDSAGNLYGTTRDGGSGNNGTVYKVDPSGNETVLYNFTGGNDGGNPEGGVVMDQSGNLYGTASVGGSAGDGTVFKLDRSGNETVLHSFTGGSDGSTPYETGLLLDSSGNLYGTTSSGGSAGFGTVFKVDPSGSESVIHSFTGPPSDGEVPYTALVLDQSRNLYGTAQFGGSSGNGIVFKITLPVPFSAFSAKLDITSGPPPGFDLNANFTQGSGAPAIDPVTQNVMLSVGSYSVTIPPGSFQKTGTGRWVYDGTIGGATLAVRISQTGASSYQVQVDASGPDLTTLSNPVTVTLSIGQNAGTTRVKAGF